MGNTDVQCEDQTKSPGALMRTPGYNIIYNINSIAGE